MTSHSGSHGHEDAVEDDSLDGLDRSTNNNSSSNSRPAKRSREFIARQACEYCRQKKTRCDEDFPCGLCRSLKIECRYNQRKPTKNETSMSMILSVMRRMESKIDTISSSNLHLATDAHSSTLHGASGSISHSTPHSTQSLMDVCNASPISISAQKSLPSPGTISSHPLRTTPISFSAHGVLSWPGIQALLPEAVKICYHTYGENYAATLESHRPPLPMSCMPGCEKHTNGWLAGLSISVVKELSDSYFASFNLANPILDRRFYFQHIIGVAINGNFGYEIESCLVLVVMALGCYGRKAFREAGFPYPSQKDYSASVHQEGGSIYHLDPCLDGDIAGLVFFNEARKRMGFTMCDNTMQSCQLYLLAGLYYAQSARPMEWWSMTSRATLCSITFWDSKSRPPANEWETDMQSRLFWNAMLWESILTHELHLPASRIKEFEDRVPLPKFLKFQTVPFLAQPNSSTRDDEDDTNSHYHFLSQIAHRTFLTRVRDTIFYSSPIGDYPSSALEEELDHQLELWRTQLPAGLSFDTTCPVPSGDSASNILVVSWLRGRYWVAKFQMGRPLLHKALHYPDALTISDLQKCGEILEYIVAWAPFLRLTQVMKNCMPLKFSICSQLFGQLLLMYCFKTTPRVQLHKLLPSNYQDWCAFALHFLEECAPYSPALTKDLEIASILCEYLL